MELLSNNVVAEVILLVITSLVGSIVWFVRLEGRVNYNERILIEHRDRYDEELLSVEKRLDELTVKHHALDNKIVEQLASVRETLAKIEGYLLRAREGEDETRQF